MKSELGSALIKSLLAVFLTAMSTIVIFQQVEITEKQARLPRIKSEMILAEQRLRTAIASPYTYTGCDSNLGFSSCTLANKTQLEADLSRKITGADCATPNCGIRVSIDNPVVNASGVPQVRATIRYEGREANFKGLENVMIDVPKEVLQSAVFLCPSTRPVFNGFDNLGRLICDPLPADCGPGEYIESLDNTNLSITCRTIQGPAACDPDQFLNSFEWRSGMMPGKSCISRLNPFTYFNFTPSIAIGGSQ